MLRAITKLFSPPPPAQHSRRYEGVQSGRRLANASSMPNPALAGLAARGRLASRSRYLVANNALASAAAQGWVSGLVGSGIVAQSAHPDPATPAIVNARQASWVDLANAQRESPLAPRGLV